MAHTKPPVIGTAVTAWSDAFRAIGAMPAVAGIAFALVLVTSLGSFALIDNGGFAFVGSLRLLVISIGASIVQGVLLAPLAIAVHRFVLLGERTNRYPLEPGSSRFRRFAAFAILFKLLWLFPSTSLYLFGHTGYGDLVRTVVFVAIVIVMVRRAILFPGIAIDAPGATWSNARRDTKGSSWRVALIFVLTGLPPLIVVMSYFWLLLGVQEHYSTGSVMLFNTVQGFVGTAALCAFAAAASHIYRARADAMTEPGGSSGPASPAASPSS